jgi:hypothetical protein
MLHVRSEVVTEMIIFWYVTACGLVEVTNFSEEYSASTFQNVGKQTTRRSIPEANILQNFNMNVAVLHVYVFCLWEYFFPCDQPSIGCSPQLKDRGCDNVLPGQGCRTSQGKGAIGECGAMMELWSTGENRRNWEYNMLRCNFGHQELYKIEPQTPRREGSV